MNVARMSRGCWGACWLWSASACAASVFAATACAATVWTAPVWAAADPGGATAAPAAATPAQPPSTPVAPPQSTPPPATANADESSEAIEAREVAADAAFRRGNELADRGELESALVEFERAYDLVPANEVLHNIGAVCYELKRWARARRAYEQYLRFGGSDLPPDRIESVSTLIAELTGKTATLRLLLNVTGADVQVDGEPVQSNEVSGVILDPGEHVVRVSKPGFAPLEQVLRTINGESVQVVLPLAPLQRNGLPAEGPFATTPLPRVESFAADDGRIPLWLPWTVTGVLAAGWMTTAGLAIKARHDRDIIERPSTSPDRIDDARRLHKTLAIVSDVLLASTLVSGGVSAYMTWWPRSDPAASHGSPQPRLAVDGLTLGVFGEF